MAKRPLIWQQLWINSRKNPKKKSQKAKKVPKRKIQKTKRILMSRMALRMLMMTATRRPIPRD